MHGRLKVKTSADKEAEKQKEREEKRKLYLAGLHLVFTKRKENVSDIEGLVTSAKLLVANPDALTLWNIRREVLLAMKKDHELENWKKLLLDELKTTEHCLMQNPKSYGAWLHRDWIFRIHPTPPYEEEVELCNKYLQMDERNFHCWDHRRLILSRCDHRSLSEELKFTQELINRNFSNYSAWHYRSKLLPLVYPNENNSQLPLPEDIFIKELKQVVTAVFTDPSDQSPWFFLRWLLNPTAENPGLWQLGLTLSDNKVDLILVFNQPTSNPSEYLSIFLNTESEVSSSVPMENLAPLANDKHVWVLPLDSKAVFPLSLRINYRGIDVVIEASSKDDLPLFKWVLNGPQQKDKLSHKVKDTLKEIIDNCLLLDEVDPGNKWVLLTLVNVMWMLNVTEYKDQILDFLNQLKNIDPLRKAYYTDVSSKVKVEAKLSHWLETSSEKIDFSNDLLSCLSNSHRLVSIKEANFSNNCLRSLAPLSHLLNCHRLILDGTPIKDLTPLAEIKQLRFLSLKSCNIESISSLQPLCSISGMLESVVIADNPVVEKLRQGDHNKDIKEIIPFLKLDI